MTITKSDVNLFEVAFIRYKSALKYKDCHCHHYAEISRLRHTDHSTEIKIFVDGLKCWAETCQKRLLDTSCSHAKNLKQSFTCLKQLLHFDNCREYMSESLNSAIEHLSPCDRLPWIVEILMKHHLNDDCKLFMSTVVKLCLTAIELSGLSISEPFVVCQILRESLRIIQECKCDDFLLIVFRIYFSNWILKEYFFLETENLKHILENVSKSSIRLQDFLNQQEIGKLRNLDQCFLLNYQNFITLVDFGAVSIYTEEDKKMMDTRMMRMNKTKSLPSNVVNSTNSKPFYGCLSHLRSFQVIQLFHEKQLPGRDFVLKLLWSAIPDPFLIYEEFYFSVKDIIRGKTGLNFPLVEDWPESTQRRVIQTSKYDFEQAWLWYKKVLLNGETCLKSPRSLKHLTRCIIRQTLSRHSQFPSNVRSLELPTKFIDYLLLKNS